MRGRIMGLFALVAPMCAACGGSGEGSTSASSMPGASSTLVADSESTDSGGEESTSDTQGIVEQAEEDLEETFDTAGGSAAASIGEETWTFGQFDEMPIAVCDSDFFGGFVAVLTSDGDLSTPFNTLEVRLPGGDFQDPPYVKAAIGVDGDAEWIADETIYERTPGLPAGLGVTELSIDGGTASGKAVFYEEESFHQFNAGNADALIVSEGTLEVSCISE